MSKIAICFVVITDVQACACFEVDRHTEWVVVSRSSHIGDGSEWFPEILHCGDFGVDIVAVGVFSVCEFGISHSSFNVFISF